LLKLRDFSFLVLPLLLQLVLGFDSRAVLQLFEFAVVLSEFADLALFFIEQSLQFLDLLVSLLECSLELRSAGLGRTSALELFLQGEDFLLLYLHLPHQLFEFVAVD
jgi:hypothetical protein